jgi:hypothetical protein
MLMCGSYHWFENQSHYAKLQWIVFLISILEDKRSFVCVLAGSVWVWTGTQLLHIVADIKGTSRCHTYKSTTTVTP